MAPQETIPLTDLLADQKITKLPDGERAVGAFLLIGAIDADGDDSYWSRYVGDINQAAAAWKLSAYLRSEMDDELRAWTDDD